MLEYEWRELETLCNRISDLRHRYSFALRTRNVGLSEGLKEDIARLNRQREDVVRHISARLGSASAERKDPSEATDRAPADEPSLADSAPAAANTDSADDSQRIVGFASE